MRISAPFTPAPSRGRLRRVRGVGAVEFALMAPMGFLLVLGVVITGIAVTNQNLLSDGVRDVARAAAICGGSGRDSKTELPSAGSQAAQTCSWSALASYAQARLSQLAGSGGLSAPPSSATNCETLGSGAGVALVCLYDSTNTVKAYTGDPLDSCQQGYKIEISSQYGQPLYLPLVGRWLGSNGSTTTRTLSADATVVCEQ